MTDKVVSLHGCTPKQPPNEAGCLAAVAAPAGKSPSIEQLLTVLIAELTRISTED